MCNNAVLCFAGPIELHEALVEVGVSIAEGDLHAVLPMQETEGS